MTGRTHDLAAFTALSYIVATQPVPAMSLATAITALSASFLGALAPDIDQPTAKFWDRVPIASIFGKILSPVLGGHRYISHSLLGIGLFGFVLKYLLDISRNVLIVDMEIVWWAFMIGFVSHLVIDSLNKEGVPWLFPLPIRFGFPPFKFLRIKTGGMFEKTIIFPGLIVLNGYIYYSNYQKFLDFIKIYIR